MRRIDIAPGSEYLLSRERGPVVMSRAGVVQPAREALTMAPAVALLAVRMLVGRDDAAHGKKLARDGGSWHGQTAGDDIKRRESYGKRDDWKA